MLPVSTSWLKCFVSKARCWVSAGFVKLLMSPYFCSLCPELPLPWAGRECQTQYRGLGGSANSLDYSEIPVTKYCSASVEHRLGHDDIFILPYLVIIYPLHVKSINVTSSRCFWMDIWQVKDKSWIYRGGIENLLCKRGLMGSEKSRSHSE